MASRDRNFSKDIWNGSDTHMFWAEKIVCKFPEIIGEELLSETLFERELELASLRKERPDLEQKMGKFRKSVKNILVFPAFYGASKDSIAGYFERDWCKIPNHILESLFEEFWDLYRDVKVWQKELINFYNEHRYIESLTGRRRRAPLSINKVINFPIQSIASYDICLCAGDRLSKNAYELSKPQYQYRIQIHDELVFYIPEETLEEDIEFIAKEMVNPVYDFINVPLGVECSIGKDWEHMEKVCKFNSLKWWEVHE